MEEAIICNKKRCKEVFHIHENRDPGGINDYGYIVVKCKVCGTLTKVRMANPSGMGYFDNFDIIASWEDGEHNQYEDIPEGETALVSGKEPSEGVTIPFKPNPFCPLWQNGKVNLEITANNSFKKVCDSINEQLYGLRNVFLKSMPGFDDIERCIVEQEYEVGGVVYNAKWAKVLKYGNTMNSNLFHLIDHSYNDKQIDGVYSRNEMMSYLYRCLMRWKLVASQVIVITPFIGFDFLFSKEEDKQELLCLWDLLNSMLDIKKTTFITRVSTYGSLKKYLKHIDVPADVLKKWNLMSNLQSMIDNPKTRVKTSIPRKILCGNI